MADYFLESSALIKRYKIEPGTDIVNSLFIPTHRLFYLNLAAFEVRKVFCRLYRYPMNQDRPVSRKEYERLLAFFDQDLIAMHCLDLDDRMLRKIDAILDKVWLKSIFDLAQLSAFLTAQEQYPDLIFVCSDVRSNLVEAAKIFVADRYVLVPERSM